MIRKPRKQDYLLPEDENFEFVPYLFEVACRNYPERLAKYDAAMVRYNAFWQFWRVVSVGLGILVVINPIYVLLVFSK